MEETWHLYEVGKLYNPNRTSWAETPQLRIAPQGIELVLFYDRPDAEEITAAKTGRVRFAWVNGDRVSVLCYKIGGEPWSDAPFEIRRQPDDEQGWAATWVPEANFLVTLMLVDASDGVIRVIRAFGWPPGFLAAVRDGLVRQLGHHYNPQAAGAELDRLYKSHTSADLAKNRSVATCVI